MRLLHVLVAMEHFHVIELAPFFCSPVPYINMNIAYMNI